MVGAMVAGGLGAAFGIILYSIIVRPILALFQGVGRQAGETLAALLAPFATRWIRERGGGKPPGAGSAPAAAVQSPGMGGRQAKRPGPEPVCR